MGLTNRLNNKNDISLKFPIILSVVYLVFSLFVYIICPYNWPTEQPVLFYGLNIMYIFALWLGYMVGQRQSVSLQLIEWNEEKTDKLMKVVSVLVIFNVLFYIIHIFRTYAFATPDFIGLFKEMSVGLQNPGLGYKINFVRQQTLDGPNVLGGTAFTILNLGWGFIKNIVIILAMIFFKKLKLYGKIFTILYLAIVVVFYISIGTNIQFLHVLLLVEIPVIVETFQKWHKKEINRKAIIKLIVFILVGCILLLCYFGWMMESRSAASGYDISEYEIGGLKPDDGLEGPVSNSKLMNLWYSFSSYLTQGYYAMSQALSVEWTPMFGLGSSMWVVDIVSNNIYDIDQFTYQVKLEEFGWDSDVRWHSMYTWLANDFSFYGVILAMFVIGLLFGGMFKDAIKNKNPFALASIFFFMLMLIFAPCNNQVGQTNENLCPFILLILIWLLCKREKGPKILKTKKQQ